MRLANVTKIVLFFLASRAKKDDKIELGLRVEELPFGRRAAEENRVLGETLSVGVLTNWLN